VKADDLKPLVDTLTERLNTTIKLLDELKSEHKKLQQEHNDHRREAEKENAVLKREVEELKKSDAEKEIAILKQQVDELKKSKDLWSNRVFTLVMCLVSGVLGGIITYLVKKP
jgi:hypothetical protein